MSGKTTMTAKEQLRGRRDKAALLQTGRLAERRLNREEQDHQAQLDALRGQLEEAQREATMAKGGGGAMKELQKELADLRVTLAESEAALVAAAGERDAAVKERDDVLAGRPGAPQAVLRQEKERATALEKDIKTLQAKLAQADERTAQAAVGAGNSNEEMTAREEKVKEMERRCSTMQQDASKAVAGLADLKTKLAEVEELKDRETQRRTRQLKHAEERAERMREELITVWEASNRGQFSEAGKNKFVTKALELEKSLQAAQERIVQLEDKGLEGKVVAAEKIAKRFFALIEFLRITEADADKLVKDGIAWPAPGAGPQNLIELMQALAMAPPPPAPAPAPVPAKPATPPPPKEEPKPAPPALSAQEQNMLRDLQLDVEDLKALVELNEQAMEAKLNEIIKLEADRQRLEDEVAKQKSKTLLAERDAQERNDELIQVKGRKDKEATDLEKERTKLKHEVDRQKRRADEALADNQKLAADHANELAQIEQERDEAESSLARLVERQDRTKAEHEATMNQLVSRIKALESSSGSTGAATPPPPASDASGTRTLDKERNKHQSDLAFFRRQVEELVETARIKEEEHVRQMDSKIKELELLEEERDRYRDEVNAARAAADKNEARVSKPMSRAASRSASPALGVPSTPEKKKPVRADSSNGGDDLGWAQQQQKQAVLEHLEKERARLEGELAAQTRMAEEALVEAGAHRSALEQLRSSRATDSSSWDAERHRLEVELGSQATLAMQRARELDAERERMAGLVRQVAELEKERTTLRGELVARENGQGTQPPMSAFPPSSSGPWDQPQQHSKAVGAQFNGVAPGSFVDRSSAGTPVSQSFGAPQGMPSFGSPVPSAAMSAQSAAGNGVPVSGPVRLLVEHLRKTNRELNHEVLSLKDENMTLMMRLAGL
ncbi:hypothetical protein JCM8208_002244 [Rhodotorula glutinis]